MGIIDTWAERLHGVYNEKWIPLEVMRDDNKEGIKKISEFFDVCEARGSHQTKAYVNKESVFFRDYESGIKKIKNKNIIYNGANNPNPLTFLVCADNVLIEDNKQLFIKYNTKLLGKEINGLFDRIGEN